MIPNAPLYFPFLKTKWDLKDLVQDNRFFTRSHPVDSNMARFSQKAMMTEGVVRWFSPLKPTMQQVASAFDQTPRPHTNFLWLQYEVEKDEYRNPNSKRQRKVKRGNT